MKTFLWFRVWEPLLVWLLPHLNWDHMTGRLQDILDQTTPRVMVILVALRERDGGRQVMLVRSRTDNAEVPDRFDLPVTQVYCYDDMLPVDRAFVDLYRYDQMWRERFRFHRMVWKDGANQVWLVHVVDADTEHKEWHNLDNLPTGLVTEDAGILDYVKAQLNQ